MEDNKSTYFRFQNSNILRMSPLSKFRELNENTFLYNPLNVSLSKEIISNCAFSDYNDNHFNEKNPSKSIIKENSIISKENASTSINTNSLELKEEDSYNSSRHNEALQLTSLKKLLRKAGEKERLAAKTYRLKNCNEKFNNNAKTSIKQFWNLKEDYFLLRLLFTSPYGLNSVLNYLPKTRTIQSYKSRIVSFTKRFKKPLVSNDDNDTINQTNKQSNIYKIQNKIKCEYAFMSILKDVISHFNLQSIQDFIAFESNEVNLPQKFLIDKEDLIDTISNLPKSNQQVCTNNQSQTSIDDVFLSKSNNQYLENKNNLKNDIKADSETIYEAISDLKSSKNQDQLINFFLKVILKKKEKLKFDPELLQTQLFKSYQ